MMNLKKNDFLARNVHGRIAIGLPIKVAYYYFYKVNYGAKIKNRYNQVPRLTQDTNGKVTNSTWTPQTRAKKSVLSQQVTTRHILTDVHKGIANTRQKKHKRSTKEVPPWNGQ